MAETMTKNATLRMTGAEAYGSQNGSNRTLVGAVPDVSLDSECRNFWAGRW